ncbi:hypothetical protein DPX16_5638 [Anabarilius grahami]|uniref:Uncharacterized protein n=1 Tax=Anabarilius grahami TaxID=495550 RepID=A0A3N0YQ16_ANAGA|nr:hypothetical protein DPX16_5638 [Anabarilius grahami]
MLAGRSVPNASAAHTRNPPAPRVSPGMSSIPAGMERTGQNSGEVEAAVPYPQGRVLRNSIPRSAMTKTPGKRSPKRGKLRRPHPARRETSIAFKLHQSFYECLTKDSQNLISPDRVPEMESADKFYSPSLRIWPQKIRQEEVHLRVCDIMTPAVFGRFQNSGSERQVT